MQIDIHEVLDYLQRQRLVFLKLGELAQNPFNDGILEGLNLVKQYLLIRQENELNSIAEAFKDKT